MRRGSVNVGPSVLFTTTVCAPPLRLRRRTGSFPTKVSTSVSSASQAAPRNPEATMSTTRLYLSPTL